MKLANEKRKRAIYLVAKCYRDGIGTDKNLGEVVKWFKKYELSNFFRRLPITLNDFLNSSDIVVYKWINQLIIFYICILEILISVAGVIFLILITKELKRFVLYYYNKFSWIILTWY